MHNYYEWQIIRIHHEEDIIMRHGYFKSKDDTTAKAKALADSGSRKDATKLRKQYGYGPTEWELVGETETTITYTKPITETTYLNLIRKK